MPRPGAPPSALRLLPLLLAAALAGCGRSQAPVTTIQLVPTGDTVVAPYGDITDAAWLGERRWAVLSPQDRAVSVADFNHHTLTPFGGAARKELEQPFGLFRSNDSLYVTDWLRRRLTSWSLAGAMGGQLGAVGRLRGALPRARDAQGNWYFELRPAPGPDGSGNRDSGAIVRASVDLARTDTIARLAPFELAEVISDGRRRLERRLLSGQDRWGVHLDGTLWIARIGQNRVDWRDPAGKVTEGDDLPDAVLPVTQNDRDLFLARFEPSLRATVSQTPFTAIKPAFENALTGPDGMVWLVKNRAIGDTVRNYQVVDPSGRLVRTAQHHGLGRILALADSQAVVGEPFEGGVRLLLFRLPAAAPAGPRSSP